MAFNWQTFRTRALSSMVFVAIMAVGLLWNEWSFLLLFSVVHFGCWWEYYKLVKKMHGLTSKVERFFHICFMIGSWGLMLLFWKDRSTSSSFWVPSLGQAILYTFLLMSLGALVFKFKKINWKVFFALLLGILYISLSLALLVRLRTHFIGTETAYALAIPLLIIFTNWINDTMAYIVGSLIGKTPLSSISPKKTWEGTIGGALLAVLTISLIAFFSGLLPVGHAAALAALGAISGTYGDLAESKLKRLAGVKDSGTMMPGHGGFLDRFDSLLFSATVGAIYVTLLMQG